MREDVARAQPGEDGCVVIRMCAVDRHFFFGPAAVLLEPLPRPGRTVALVFGRLGGRRKVTGPNGSERVRTGLNGPKKSEEIFDGLF